MYLVEMMLKAASHAVFATNDVPRLVRFFTWAFELKAHFENEMFAEFVLKSGFRIAFFKPVGKAAKFFRATPDRGHLSLGLTVDSVDEFYNKIQGDLSRMGASASGPPKSHPWGEKSFLLIDPDGNRWEITQSPSANGLLVNLP